MAQQNQRVTASAGWWVDLGSTGHPATFYAHLKQYGILGVFLDCATPGYPEDVSAALGAGLQVQLFQGYWDPMWASTSTALSRAHSAIQAAQAVHYPTGCTLWLDAEGMPSGMSAQNWLDWVNAWSKLINSVGYSGGIYLAGTYAASSEQLYANLPYIHHYWQGMHMSKNVDTRGYTVTQDAVDINLFGVLVDKDTVKVDQLHQLPTAMALASAPTTGTPSTSTPSTGTSSTSLTLLASEVASLQKTVAGHTQSLQQITDALDALVTAAKKMTLP